MKAFEIKVAGKSLDYRAPGELDLADVRRFFERKYEVVKIWQGGRHVLADIKVGDQALFLKLATSEGISEVTKVEYDWNVAFNKQVSREPPYRVPANFDCGLYKNKFFYLVTDKFKGQLLVGEPKVQNTDAVLENIGRTMDLCEFIGELKFENLADRFYVDLASLRSPRFRVGAGGRSEQNYKDFFVGKARAWLDAIPGDVREDHGLENLFEIVKDGAADLEKRPRHGDFAPWHIFKLADEKLGLIDAEHALAGGVENYDICYFIQRVFSVLEAPGVAKRIFGELMKRNYEVEKLKTILAARAIGGFLDETFNKQANYSTATKFKDWVLNLNNY